MPLAAGTKLGPYEILAPLGAGGMGEVYRGRDTKLDREVAVKVLPASLARDPERLARFEREAKVLASLNHPNIAQIYGVQEAEGYQALVMELVPGETLGAVIKTSRTGLPLEEASKMAAQMVDALSAAHDKGITHRDFKPANVMITTEGVVKVLDFGLAAVSQTTDAATGTNVATLTMSPTSAGMIMGTAPYMSPEQARGAQADRRSDIFSFGVVLYEMLTAKQLFHGETVSDVLAAVLKDSPKLDDVPEQVRPLLQRCLQKDPKKRLQSIGDWDLLLSNPLPSRDSHGAGTDTEHSARSLSRLSYAGWIAAGVFALLAAAVTLIHFRETPEQTSRYSITLPENSAVHSFALSPDGRTLVIAAAAKGRRQLWLRPMGALQFQPMPFTEDAAYPFWSPDSRYIGFFAQQKLKKVAASGGPAQSLCDVPNARGGSWGRDDVIVFSPSNSGASIQRVSAAGGVPFDVSKTKGDLKHPVFLPDSRHFLYVSATNSIEQGIFVDSLDGKEHRRVLPDVSGAAFAPLTGGGRTGLILFSRENTLMAAPFDPASAQLAGDVFPIAEGVSLTTNVNYLPAAVSENGVLVYLAGGDARGSQLSWFGRSGEVLGKVGAAGSVFEPAISPDEKLVVYRRQAGLWWDLWIHDQSRGTEIRFTNSASVNSGPFWSPKGDRIVFESNRNGGVYNLYQKAASGSGQEEPLLPNTNTGNTSQWSRDGRFIVYNEIGPKTNHDIWVLPDEGPAAERKPVLFLQTEFDEIQGQLSPDSHWMAFTSDRSGRREVYVRPFPPGDGEWSISLAGGEMPRWRGDGKELFYEAADGKMMAVAVKAVAGAKPSFEAGTPVALFDAHMVHAYSNNLIEYDVTADGKRFLVNANAPGAAAPPLTVVTNWQSGLKK
jgi:eukaryotic-like serine/threonine-protein kinase